MEHLRPVQVGLLAARRAHVGLNTVGGHLLTVHGRHLALVVLRAAHDRRHMAAVAVGVVNILNRDHAEWVNHAVGGHVVHAVELVHLALASDYGLLGCLRILFNVSLGVRQVAGASRVTATDGALLEVALEDIRAREGVTAQNTHVGAVAGI